MLILGGFFVRLSQRYMAFMQGRYGNDEFNVFLLIASLVLMLLSRSIFLWFLYPIALFMIIFCLVRTYSRNISKRYNERQWFLRKKNSFMSWYRIKADAWNNRRTDRYFRCKKCRASVIVPKGVGKIEVTCPKCRNKFIKTV